MNVSVVPRMVVMIGSRGSGKSTLSSHLCSVGSWVTINQDELGSKKACENIAKDELLKGSSIIIDRCNIEVEQRAFWLDIARQNGLADSVVAIWLDVRTDTCISRVQKRVGHPTLPPGPQSIFIIKRMANALQPPQKYEGFMEIYRVQTEAELSQVVLDLCHLDHIGTVTCDTQTVDSESDQTSEITPSPISSNDSMNDSWHQHLGPGMLWGRVPYERRKVFGGREILGCMYADTCLNSNDAWDVFVNMFNDLLDIEALSAIFNASSGDLEEAVKAACSGVSSAEEYELICKEDTSGLQSEQLEALENLKGVFPDLNGTLILYVLQECKFDAAIASQFLLDCESDGQFLSSLNKKLPQHAVNIEPTSFADVVKGSAHPGRKGLATRGSISFGPGLVPLKEGKQGQHSLRRNCSLPPTNAGNYIEEQGRWLQKMYPGLLKQEEMHGLLADSGFDTAVAEEKLRMIFPQIALMDKNDELTNHLENAFHCERQHQSLESREMISEEQVSEINSELGPIRGWQGSLHYRQLASEEAFQMKECYRCASQEYRRHGGSAAVRFIEKGNLARNNMLTMNLKAAVLVMEEKNPHITVRIAEQKGKFGKNSNCLLVTGWKKNGNGTGLTVDLHGLRVTEALQAVHSIILHHKSQGSRGAAMKLHLVTGIGSHSNVNGPRLKPAVGRLLDNLNVRATYNGSGIWIVDRI